MNNRFDILSDESSESENDNVEEMKNDGVKIDGVKIDGVENVSESEYHDSSEEEEETSSMNFDEKKFTGKITLDPSDLTCSICMSMPIKPCNLKCGHLFCHSCIRSWFESAKGSPKEYTCPNCNNVNGEVINECFYLQNLLAEQERCCDNKEQGCKWTGKYKKFNDHANNHCLYESTICNYKCSKKPILRKNLEEHYKTCPNAPVECKYCGLKCNRRMVKIHEDLCGEKPIQCFFCEEKFKRKNIINHIGFSSIKCKKYTEKYMKFIKKYNVYSCPVVFNGSRLHLDHQKEIKIDLKNDAFDILSYSNIEYKGQVIQETVDGEIVYKAMFPFDEKFMNDIEIIKEKDIDYRLRKMLTPEINESYRNNKFSVKKFIKDMHIERGKRFIVKILKNNEPKHIGSMKIYENDIITVMGEIASIYDTPRGKKISLRTASYQYEILLKTLCNNRHICILPIDFDNEVSEEKKKQYSSGRPNNTNELFSMMENAIMGIGPPPQGINNLIVNGNPIGGPNSLSNLLMGAALVDILGGMRNNNGS